ncbi:MAG: ubiquinol-cytochrome C chaperone family protein [Bradyrhizobium sp.]
MISLPFRRSQQSRSIDALYGMIVAQARSPSFYLSYGVPDTVTARLDMILLHLVLVLRQLATDAATADCGQPLFKRFCQDIDDNFREMGVGDLTVPKKMRQVVEAFYGRAKVYEEALAADGDEALIGAVARNVYGATEPPLGANRLAAYMREAARSLAAQSGGILTSAGIRLPDPEAIRMPAASSRLVS